jgi:hypothetical protein
MTNKRKNLSKLSKKTNKTLKNKNIKSNDKRKQKTAKRKRNYKIGGVVGYDLVGNRITQPRIIANLDARPFWESYFNSDFNKMSQFKAFVQKMMKVNTCKYLKSKISAFEVTESAKSYKESICLVTLLFSYLSSLLEFTCNIVVKGGRAMQIALSSRKRYDPIRKRNIPSVTYIRKYPSNDIDFLILPESKRLQDSQLIALRIGEFIDWLTNFSDAYGNPQTMFSFIHLPKPKLPVQSNPEIPTEGSIVKMSISVSGERGNKFIAISDIGYITSEHSEIFESNPIKTIIDDNPQNPGFLLSVNPQNLFLEKTYYIVKYISKNYLSDYQLNRYRASLHKSYNYLLNDLLENIVRSLKVENSVEATKPKEQLKNELIDYYFNELKKVVPSTNGYEVSVEELIAFLNGTAPNY